MNRSIVYNYFRPFYNLTQETLDFHYQTKIINCLVLFTENSVECMIKLTNYASLTVWGYVLLIQKTAASNSQRAREKIDIWRWSSRHTLPTESRKNYTVLLLIVHTYIQRYRIINHTLSKIFFIQRVYVSSWYELKPQILGKHVNFNNNQES